MAFRKKALMLKAFEAFTDRMTERYEEVFIDLQLGNYVSAQRKLTEISISHAKTSLSLRNVLVKEGLLPEDGK